MPIYEYRCAGCGHHLEALQKMADAPLRKCPECGKAQLRRLVSASQFRLKGSGWYETDFKNKNETKRNLSGAETEPASATPSESTAKDEVKKEVQAAKSETDKPKGKPAAPKKKPRARSGASKTARG